MTSEVRPVFYNSSDENDGESDSIRCPLLELIKSRGRNPITNRLGQKTRYLKHINDKQPLLEKRKAEVNLESSFKICRPKKLANKRNILKNTPIVCQANDSGLEIPDYTFTDLKRKTIRKLNFKPTLPLSTKQSLFYNKENLAEQKQEELKTTKSKILTQSHTGSTSCLLPVKKSDNEITKKSLMIVKDDKTYVLSNPSRNNHDSGLFFNGRETNSAPESSDLSSSIKISNSLVDSSLLVELFENDIGNICITCANDNYISVKGINYYINNTLGHGGTSVVYEALHPVTNKVVAIKKVDLSGVEDIIAEGYLNEVTLLKNLQGCTSVIRLIDSQYNTKEKILYMVMEKGNTDLSNLIRSTKSMSVHMIMYYWSEMLTTVNEVHSYGIIHSDLKPANFLLVSGRLKLIDFGIASKIQGDMTSVLKDITAGTWNYMSPECIRNEGSYYHGHKMNQKSDVWSLGCILYSLVYDKTPFSHLENTLQKLHAIGDLKQNICFPSNSTTFKNGIPPVLMQSMQLCLLKDVKSRPSVVDLMSLMENIVFKSMVK